MKKIVLTAVLSILAFSATAQMAAGVRMSGGDLSITASAGGVSAELAAKVPAGVMVPGITGIEGDQIKEAVANVPGAAESLKMQEELMSKVGKPGCTKGQAKCGDYAESYVNQVSGGANVWGAGQVKRAVKKKKTFEGPVVRKDISDFNQSSIRIYEKQGKELLRSKL